MPPSASIGQKQKKSAENTRKGVYFVKRVVAAVLCGLVLTIGEGSYRAIVSGQRSVTRGKSYTLKLNYTINGVAQPEQSVTKVCR